MGHLRIYTNEQAAPYRDSTGRNYYRAPVPQGVLEVPDIMRHIGGRILEFAIRTTGSSNAIGRQGVPLMSAITGLAWGIRSAGRIYVRGQDLPAVVMVHQALSCE